MSTTSQSVISICYQLNHVNPQRWQKGLHYTSEMFIKEVPIHPNRNWTWCTTGQLGDLTTLRSFADVY